MKFNLQGNFTFSSDVTSIKKDIEKFISETIQNLLKKDTEKKTNIGALLNTSFNLHGYPIVLNAKDAIGVFLNSDLDALLLEDVYIEKKERKHKF